MLPLHGDEDERVSASDLR